MSRLVLIVVTAALAVLVLASPASAQTVSCGQVLTAGVRLDNDLVDCPGNGLVIGAAGITVDLNGHRVDGLSRSGPCVPDCLQGRGIDNTAGYDRVSIRNGTVTQFERGVILVGAERNVLAGLTVGASVYGEVFSPVTLIKSDHNRILDSRMGAGQPGLLLFLSDHNTIARSTMHGGITLREGDGVALVQADYNRVVDSQATGEGFGAWIEDAVGNQLARGVIGGYHGNILRNVSRTRVTGNELTGRGATSVSGESNLVADNRLTNEGGLSVEGDYNRIVGNTKFGGQSGIEVGAGHGILVRLNRVEGVVPGISVAAGATAARVVDNTANGNYSDGIRVYAPGALIARNTANDNEDLGILAVSGVIDGGGNRASGNGDPLQCVNVFCQ